MYLSCLLIDTGDNPDRPRPGRLWLRNLYRVHQRLCMSFPSAERKENDAPFLTPFKPYDFPYAHTSDHKHDHIHGQRTSEQAFLFRVDPLLSGNAMIIVQSAIKPNWNYAFQNAGILLAAPPQMKPYDPHFETGQSLKFRLLANPTRRLCPDSKGVDGNPVREEWLGKRVPVPADQLEQWLMRRAEKSGFVVENFYNIQTGYAGAARHKDDNLKNFFFARYDGLLRVTDAELLRGAVIHGIGSAKGFGFGLLSIAPVRN